MIEIQKQKLSEWTKPALSKSNILVKLFYQYVGYLIFHLRVLL